MAEFTPYYRLDETARLLSAVPAMRLAREREALRLLKRTLADVHELAPVLAQYPHTRYEPLDFVYVLLQSLGALDEHLLTDLCAHFGWPGVVWASLLATLHPRPAYIPVLRAARERVPHNQWAVDMALGTLQGVCAEDLQEHCTVALELRDELAKLPWPRVTLTRERSVEEVRLTADRVREAYRRGGLAAALKARSA